MFACFKCFRPKWVNDRILLGQWVVHALVLAIVRDMGRNTRNTLYKCTKVHIYTEQMSRIDNYQKENHSYVHVGLVVVRR